jgi:beta-phosphoglucomutase-like phosphatase (HAD superfamily)
MAEFVGQNFRGMVQGLEKRFNFTLSDEERESYVVQEEDRVIANLEDRAIECEGAKEQLVKLSDGGKYKLSVVSSSAYRRVIASIKKVGHDVFFKPDEVFSAATSLPKPTSKPDPAIYLWAMEKLGVKPEECIAVEDSKSGTLSAVRAGIITIAYSGSFEDPSKADEVAKMLMDNGAKIQMKHWKDFPEVLAKIEAM